MYLKNSSCVTQAGLIVTKIDISYHFAMYLLIIIGWQKKRVVQQRVYYWSTIHKNIVRKKLEKDKSNILNLQQKYFIA